MSVELRPLGVKCNIQCLYCYQHPERDSSTSRQPYDIQAMKDAILKTGGPFTLFGGEPLLLPTPDLEALLSWGWSIWGRTSIQTNATLLSSHHIALFQRYNVGVGISIDGPGELNDVRWQGTVEKTRQATQASERAIRALCQAGRPPSLIITLHRLNTGPRLPTLLSWVKELISLGVRAFRLHLLEAETEVIRSRLAIDDRTAVAAMLSFRDLAAEENNASFDVFNDVARLLRGDDNGATCTWNACDPFTTAAVQGVEGNGQRSNCGRTNKEGVGFVKAERPGYERYIALYHTPFEYGGCSGCRFFSACKGQCPGTAIDGDWRNRSEQCSVWFHLFEVAEEEMLQRGETPISQEPRRSATEQRLLEGWMRGKNLRIADADAWETDLHDAVSSLRDALTDGL